MNIESRNDWKQWRKHRHSPQQEELPMNMEPRNIPGTMTEEEYDIERGKLRETYGSGIRKLASTEARAKSDIALCKFLVATGWTHERIAKKEGVGQSSIAQRLIFGRFLSSPITREIELPKNLTETRWRLDYWARTIDKRTSYLGGRTKGGSLFNEEGRFEQVLRLIEEDAVAVAQRRPQIGKAIAEHFADGKWHALPEISAKVEAPEEHVAATLKGMRSNGYYQCKCEQREIGTVTKYRIFHEAKKVGTDELRQKLGPMIKNLKDEGKKNMATMSPPSVLYWAGMIEKQIDAWIEGKAAETKGEFEKTGLRKIAF